MSIERIAQQSREIDIRPRTWLVVLAVVSMVAGIALCWVDGLLAPILGLVLGCLVPAVAFAVHNQRLQRRASLKGEYPTRSFLWFRQTLLVSTVPLAAVLGYLFALALERAVVS